MIEPMRRQRVSKALFPHRIHLRVDAKFLEALDTKWRPMWLDNPGRAEAVRRIIALEPHAKLGEYDAALETVREVLHEQQTEHQG